MGLDIYIENKETGKEELYLRKAYVVMNWFEHNLPTLENCKTYNLNEEIIKELRDYCEECTEPTFNKSAMHRYEPINTYAIEYWIMEWDGSEEKAQWQTDRVKDTKKACERILKEGQADNITFYASW